MLNKPDIMDEAVLRQQFSQMYDDIGYKGALQVLYEFMYAANVLVDIITERQKGSVQ